MPDFDIDTLILAVPAETWESMLIEITLGKEPDVKNAAEREVRKRLTLQVDEIRRKGGIVDVPSDIP